jgi:hypothetical protein
MNRAQAELEAALATLKLRRNPPAAPMGPNQLCVTIWLKVGLLDVLLGADLEHVPGRTEGWRAIIESQERPEGRAGVFKVPHHGSNNADCPECWTTLLQQPVAILTPYTPARLPRADDLARICNATRWVYLTGNPMGYSTPRRDSAVEKTLREMSVRRRALTGPVGHVRLRSDARDPNRPPEILTYDGAERQCFRDGAVE